MDKVDPKVALLSPSELGELTESLPNWTVNRSAEVSKLIREFTFRNFAEALAFVNKVGTIAESADHHPLMTVTWGKVHVEWWSHSAGGVTRNDVRMAHATDELVQAG